MGLAALKPSFPDDALLLISNPESIRHEAAQRGSRASTKGGCGICHAVRQRRSGVLPPEPGDGAPGRAVVSIWPASVAAEHKKSARHERTRHPLRVFERSGEKPTVVSLSCLGDEEVIRLGRNDTSR
jgi:hypothetical protein